MPILSESRVLNMRKFTSSSVDLLLSLRRAALVSSLGKTSVCQLVLRKPSTWKVSLSVR